MCDAGTSASAAAAVAAWLRLTTNERSTICGGALTLATRTAPAASKLMLGPRYNHQLPVLVNIAVAVGCSQRWWRRKRAKSLVGAAYLAEWGWLVAVLLVVRESVYVMMLLLMVKIIYIGLMVDGNRIFALGAVCVLLLLLLLYESIELLEGGFVRTGQILMLVVSLSESTGKLHLLLLFLL